MCFFFKNSFGAAGYVIEGFHTNGESATNLLWEDVEPVLTETLGSLPENLPRAFHGPITPIVLLKLVSKGIDIFDATFPWLVAERGETLPSVKAPAVVATDQKVAKLADDNSNDEAVDRVYEIILKDKIYFSDTRPLLEGCSCYSCRKYSRSYVHHLTATGELQGPILIMMHNLHHYINFFKSIQQAIKDNELQALQSKLDLFLTHWHNRFDEKSYFEEKEQGLHSQQGSLLANPLAATLQSPCLLPYTGPIDLRVTLSRLMTSSHQLL
ncbi:hypothetical protein DAPPUDRAFT_315960 [Daphnia pulex]|uniref:tRNA-guanine(15) transglycosylase-like domain-containing protein n=1 Tax=Daphnia pulex TaxID=6669 RepID=E9GC53_DAPPU|nr:hypothetical protein DAPPUDRAFT_315960 [Daphnia pulex]|eukprot:EFX83201.1 hypothetical protein DAPPUDRAFT_315960 [Daphnia pulex]